MDDVAIDWKTAEVAGGALIVDLSPPGDLVWADAARAVASRWDSEMRGQSWGRVETHEGALRVDGVGDGDVPALQSPLPCQR